MPSFFIRTYGCQMNERDSEALGCLLKDSGYTQADAEEDADVLLFNTCSVRDQAERKVIGKVGLLKRLKREKPGVVIGIIGCMAQNHGRELLDTLPHVDLVVGTDCLQDIPELLEGVRQGRHGLVATETHSDAGRALGGHEDNQVTSYISVMRGCNQFCAYCIVPYTRGREKSRTIESIVAEVHQVTEQGAKEIFLLGQNITAYGVAEARHEGTLTPDLSPFADLLRAVHAVEGVSRIRFTSPHVSFMNDAFIDAICCLPKVCKAFHIPAQSGSDKVLARMRRGYTSGDYLRVLESIRSRVPNVCFSTDIIVGFPGETEEDFQATRTLFRAIDADMAYIFRYSPRSGTKAAEEFPDDVPDEVKRARNQVLLDDLESRVRERNRAYVGQHLEVLVEGPSKRNAARWQGRSDGNKVVIFDPPEAIEAGAMVTVLVRRATSHSLFGEVVAPRQVSAGGLS